MGLDFVELVMRCEEEFGIILDDEECSLIETPGALFALISSKLEAFPVAAGVCPTSAAFYRVRRTLCLLEPGVTQKIGPKTHLKSVFAKPGRHENWSRVQDELGIYLPHLERPPILLAASFMWAFGAVIFWCMTQNWALLAGSTVLWLAFWVATQLLARDFPSRVQTVGDLARRVSALAPSKPQGDLWPRVQELIADELGVEREKVTRDAHFFRDLGAG